LVSRLEQSWGESWKARARKRETTVQVPAVAITSLGVDWVVAYKTRTYCPRLQ